MKEIKLQPQMRRCYICDTDTLTNQNNYHWTIYFWKLFSLIESLCLEILFNEFEYESLNELRISYKINVTFKIVFASLFLSLLSSQHRQVFHCNILDESLVTETETFRKS